MSPFQCKKCSRIYEYDNALALNKVCAGCGGTLVWCCNPSGYTGELEKIVLGRMAIEPKEALERMAEAIRLELTERGYGPLGDNLAEEVERLRAENTRMRETLEENPGHGRVS